MNFGYILTVIGLLRWECVTQIWQWPMLIKQFKIRLVECEVFIIERCLFGIMSP